MPLLALRHVFKQFGATQALTDASFELEAGEIHALVGANGAGKSTLSRIISGHLQLDRGDILLEGRPVRHASSREAIRNGITMVTQETSLAPDLSVFENIVLPHVGMRGPVRWRALRRDVQALVAELGHGAGIGLDAAVADLSIGQRQLVEILKALALDSRIIIFDEPTAPLSPHETEHLFDIMRRLAARGHGLIFVSHRLEEILAVTDRVTVLREGRVVEAARPTTELNSGELVRLMVGRELQDIYARRGVSSARAQSAAAVLRVRNLVCPPKVRDVSFEVRAGEILGLAGLVGAGRSETLEAIFGLRRPVSGSIELGGEPFAPGSARDAIRAGVGLIPEDRRGQGIVPDFSVRENLLLAHLGARRGVSLGYGAQAESVRRLLAVLELPEHRLLDANMLNFSGGMQQKVILARWLVLSPRLLLLDEPTRGVDIGTRSSIYALLRRIAGEGVACVVVSSDFEEVIGLTDRIVVLSDGASVADLPSDLVDIEKLGMFAAPRSSAERTHALLEHLASRYGGVAYWIVIEADRVFCFDLVGADSGADPGFAAGAFVELGATRITHAVTGAGTGPATALIPVRGRRGHDLGLIGLSLPPDGALPAAEVLQREVEAGLGLQAEVESDAA